MKKDLITVIIPTYNRNKTIKKCIDSIINQTYRELEIIIVDDCSDDNTKEIVSKIKDKRVKYYCLKKNSGACKARNFGISKSKGMYIAFQDSDDIWKNDKIEKQIKFLKDNNYDMVFCKMERRTVNNETFEFPLNNFNMNKNAFQQLLYENKISTQCILLKKEICSNIKFDETLKKYQDWDFALQISKKYKIGFINESLVISYIQNDSISKTTNKYNALKVIYDKYYYYIKNDNIIYANFMYKFAREKEKDNIDLARIYYKKGLKANFKLRQLVKLLLLSIRNNEGR